MEPWMKVGEARFRAGFRELVTRTFRLPDGKVAEFDILAEGETVCVLALTPANRVALARQFRPGPERVLMELPGGAVDAGETPEEAIRRELMEETGYAAGTLHYAGSTYAAAYSTRVSHMFAATDCRKVAEPAPDEHEWIEVVEMPLDDFRAHLRGGQLTDAGAAYRALELLELLGLL